MAKARKLGMKTGFTPNSQADRLRCDKAYRRGRKAEQHFRKNAADKRDIAKVIDAVKDALEKTNWCELPRYFVVATLEGENSPAARKEKTIYEANRCL